MAEDVERAEDFEDEEGEVAEGGWTTGESGGENVYVDTGRGQAVPVPVGSPFVATLERLAEEAHYGEYFRVFLNGEEVINPDDAPETIESGMRIMITSYDKVGLQ